MRTAGAGLEPTAKVGAAAGVAWQEGNATPEAAVEAHQTLLQRQQASPAQSRQISDSCSGHGDVGAAADGGALMRILMQQDRAEAAALAGSDGGDVNGSGSASAAGDVAHSQAQGEAADGAGESIYNPDEVRYIYKGSRVL